MNICKVLGTVVSTKKDEKLVGTKLLLVAPTDFKNFNAQDKPFVAIDTVGAGEDEIVLVVSGSSARQTERTEGTPVDAVVIGIIDYVEMEGKRIFSKS